MSEDNSSDDNTQLISNGKTKLDLEPVNDISKCLAYPDSYSRHWYHSDKDIATKINNILIRYINRCELNILSYGKDDNFTFFI